MSYGLPQVECCQGRWGVNQRVDGGVNEAGSTAHRDVYQTFSGKPPGKPAFYATRNFIYLSSDFGSLQAQFQSLAATSSLSPCGQLWHPFPLFRCFRIAVKGVWPVKRCYPHSHVHMAGESRVGPLIGFLAGATFRSHLRSSQAQRILRETERAEAAAKAAQGRTSSGRTARDAGAVRSRATLTIPWR